MASRTLQQQVRAREMEYERQQAQKLKEKKEKKRQKIFDHLNELWREEQEARIAALAEKCAIALRCIGQSHIAAALFVQKQEALKIERLRQAEINQQRESSRFKMALQKERVRRKLELGPIMVARRRKKVNDSAAQWERSFGRFSSHKAKFTLLSRQFSSDAPCGWFAEHKEDFSLLQPSDYKHTFLHSRLFINTDDGNCSSKDNEMDAWKAAELQRQLMNSYRTMQMEIRNVMDKRKLLRGQLAGSQLMIDKKLQLLEQENLAFEQGEKETRRNTSHHQNSDKTSNAQRQCVDEPVVELPKCPNSNSHNLLDKISGNRDLSPDKYGKQEVPQGLTIIDCGSEQALHISPLEEDGQNIDEDCQVVQAGDHRTTSILCCEEDIKICLNSSSAVVEVPSRKKSRKLVGKALSGKSSKKADQEQSPQFPSRSRKPATILHACKKSLVSESLKIGSDNSGIETKENKRRAHSQARAKARSTKRDAGIKSILRPHDDTALREDRKKKPELQTLTAQKPVKAVKFS